MKIIPQQIFDSEDIRQFRVEAVRTLDLTTVIFQSTLGYFWTRGQDSLVFSDRFFSWSGEAEKDAKKKFTSLRSDTKAYHLLQMKRPRRKKG